MIRPRRFPCYFDRSTRALCACGAEKRAFRFRSVQPPCAPLWPSNPEAPSVLTNRIPRALLLVCLLCAAASSRSIPAQTDAPPAAPSTSDAPAETQKPSSIIAPAVDHLSQVVSQVQLDRWKASSRDETDSNLRSVERNVSDTLPQLVTAADAQPALISTSLPLLRNLNALCAVMIRVSVTARANAPTPQAESIAGALTALQSARNSLADQVQTLAVAQEKQIASLNSTVATLSAKASTPPLPSQPPPPSSKPTRKKKVPKSLQ